MSLFTAVALYSGRFVNKNVAKQQNGSGHTSLLRSKQERTILTEAFRGLSQSPQKATLIASYRQTVSNDHFLPNSSRTTLHTQIDQEIRQASGLFARYILTWLKVKSPVALARHREAVRSSNRLQARWGEWSDGRLLYAWWLLIRRHRNAIPAADTETEADAGDLAFPRNAAVAMPWKGWKSNSIWSRSYSSTTR